MTSVAIVVNYAAGKNQLTPLADYLSVQGVEVTSSLTVNAKPLSRGRCEELLFGVNTLVCGMAPNEETAELELQVVDAAKKLGVPIFLYCDTFGTCRRPWFRKIIGELRDNVTLFLPAKSEEVVARKLYPEAKYVTVGNPQWWRDRTPSHSREAARRKLGLQEAGTVILYGATKAEFADIHVLGEIASAVLTAPAIRRPVTILYTMHPGSFIFDESRKDEEVVRRVMSKLISLPPLWNEVGVSVKLAEKEFGTELCQCAADLVAEVMSASGVIAVLREQPLLSFMTPIFYHNHLQHTGGDFDYPIVERGASMVALESSYELGFQLLDLLQGGDYRKRQVENQQKFFEAMTADPVVLMAKALLPEWAERFK